MDVSINRRWQGMIDSAVSEGRFPSASAVLDEGLRLVEERERKLRDMRETIDASLARGGSSTAEEVMAHVMAALDERREERKRA